jgi:hypothetical protein
MAVKRHQRAIDLRVGLIIYGEKGTIQINLGTSDT